MHMPSGTARGTTRTIGGHTSFLPAKLAVSADMEKQATPSVAPLESRKTAVGSLMKQAATARQSRAKCQLMCIAGCMGSWPASSHRSPLLTLRHCKAELIGCYLQALPSAQQTGGKIH